MDIITCYIYIYKLYVGISLLAYMDGVVPTTLSAVLIASASAVGSAIYKVIFKKLMGCVTFAQVRTSHISQLSVLLDCKSILYHIQYPAQLIYGQFSAARAVSSLTKRAISTRNVQFSFIREGWCDRTVVSQCQLIP